MKTKFAVLSNYFTTYQRFKEDCEKQGWVYNEEYAPFTADTFNERNFMYFSPSWEGITEGGPRFSFTYGKVTNGTFNLDTNYEGCIREAQEYLTFLREGETIVKPIEKVLPKTIEDWLKELPRGYKERALRNTKPERLNRPCDSMSQAIMDFCTWGSTPEQAFWSNIHCFYPILPPLPDNTVA